MPNHIIINRPRNKHENYKYLRKKKKFNGSTWNYQLYFERFVSIFLKPLHRIFKSPGINFSKYLEKYNYIYYVPYSRRVKLMRLRALDQYITFAKVFESILYEQVYNEVNM